MNKSMGAASLFLGALLLSGCERTAQPTCFGIEPDGDVEKLQPCPNGWKNGETRQIKEDEFWSYEVFDPGVNKKNRSTITLKPTK